MPEVDPRTVAARMSVRSSDSADGAERQGDGPASELPPLMKPGRPTVRPRATVDASLPHPYAPRNRNAQGPWLPAARAANGTAESDVTHMKIARIAPLTYTPGKLGYFSFIRGGIGADYHQGPQFHVRGNGELLVYWGAYDFDECSNDAVSLYSVSRDRGLTWSDPSLFMADYPGGPQRVILLRLRDTDRTLMVVTQTLMDEITVDPARRVATAGSSYFRSRTRFYLRRSVDGGRAFDRGEELSYRTIMGGRELPRVGCYGAAEELVQLQSGRIVAAFMYLDADRSDPQAQTVATQHYTVACLLSDDQGLTWRRSSEITVDTPRGVMEPQIVETSPGRLFCLFRTKGGCLYQAESVDAGATWSASTPTALPSPESIARMIRLRSGRVLVVWNNVSSVTQHPRHPLSAAVSCDGGGTWSAPRVLADETGANQLSNHGIVQLDDGRILVGISHYHAIRPMSSDLDMAIFDEEWLLQG